MPWNRFDRDSPLWRPPPGLCVIGGVTSGLSSIVGACGGGAGALSIGGGGALRAKVNCFLSRFPSCPGPCPIGVTAALILDNRLLGLNPPPPSILFFPFVASGALRVSSHSNSSSSSPQSDPCSPCTEAKSGIESSVSGWWIGPSRTREPERFGSSGRDCDRCRPENPVRLVKEDSGCVGDGGALRDLTTKLFLGVRVCNDEVLRDPCRRDGPA